MRIAALVSGGVDSSVALRLLQEQGHEVTAFYLKIWLEDELAYLGQCPWQEDLVYVTQVCQQAGVPLHVVPLQKEYHEYVVTYVVAEVKAGRTPNPDIFCNKRIKFGLFFDYLNREWPDYFDKIATGHYAQLRQENERFLLVQAPDPVKDQTYFLSYLTQDQLSRILFPIGHMTKQQVRTQAQVFNLPTKDRKDSQGICFLGKLKFDDFLHHYLGNKTGDLIEYETGVCVGHHKGFWYYTIGQRHGIGLSGGPWYVVKKDTQNNRVFISKNYYSSEKQRDSFSVRDCNWLSMIPYNGQEVHVKLRHGPAMHTCRVYYDDCGNVRVTLATHDQGIAAGQFAVFYNHDVCLGAGIIV